MSRTATRGTAWIGAAALAPLLLITACGANPEAAPPAPEDGPISGEVRMLVNLSTNLTVDKWEALVAPWEKETGVKVKIEGPTGKTVAETFPTLLASGSAPDVIQSIMPTVETAPEILDLTPYDWVADTPMNDVYSADGTTNVVGIGVQAQSVVYYNKDLFAKAGITETPKSWEEFDAALSALKSVGVAKPIAFASQWATGAQVQQLWMPSQNILKPNWQNSVLDGSTKLGDMYQPMFERVAGWIDAGYTTAEDAATDTATQEANFIDGTVGMYPMGSWFTTALASDPPAFEVGVFQAPVEEAADYPGPMGASMAGSYMVWKGSQNIPAAVKLVEYLATDPAAVAKQAEMDSFARPGMDIAPDEYAALVQQLTDDAPSMVVGGNVTVGDLALPVAGFNPKFTELAQGLWQGRTPADVAAALTAWYEAEKQD